MDNNRRGGSDTPATAHDKSSDRVPSPSSSLPAAARLPLNRCNLPAVILGSLTYQRHPVPLEIDGVRAFHHDLFELLEPIAGHAAEPDPSSIT
jgi:NAD+--dinitrogen-reductase ADP-D-ribosyltransferase